MERYEFIQDNTKFEFQVFQNLTEPCPECGVPACGKEAILWYQKGTDKEALIYDGEIFDLFLEESLTDYLKSKAYADLPFFIRHWNEGIGWLEAEHIEGIELDKTDFTKALEVIQRTTLSDWLRPYCETFLPAMEAMIAKSAAQNTALRLIRG